MDSLIEFRVHPQVEAKFGVSHSGAFTANFPTMGFSEIVGTPRLVVIPSDGQFAYEWNVTTEFEGETVLLWRFYLTTGGHLSHDGDLATTFGDFGSENVGERIFVFVYGSAVNSPLLRPATVPRKKLNEKNDNTI